MLGARCGIHDPSSCAGAAAVIGAGQGFAPRVKTCRLMVACVKTASQEVTAFDGTSDCSNRLITRIQVAGEDCLLEDCVIAYAHN